MLTKLQESLLALSAIKNTLEPSLRTAKRHMRDEETTYLLGNYILIQVVSFLDEWARLEGLVPQVPSLRNTLSVASPAVKRVRKWSSLKFLRNKLLAHAPRDGDGLTDVARMLSSGRIPTAYAEQMLLGECAVYAIAVVLNMHSAEASEAVRKIYSQPASGVATHGIETVDEYISEITTIRHEIVASSPELEKSFGPHRPMPWL